MIYFKFRNIFQKRMMKDLVLSCRWIVMINMIIAITFCIGCGQAAEKQDTETASTAATTMKKATIMLYLTGSDLEAGSHAATDDLIEIRQSGIDLSEVNMLVYTGGTPKWQSEDPEIPADVNVIYQLTEEGFKQILTFDQISMGDPEGLKRFLCYSYEQFPADEYDLILWDHGSGPVIGYGSDKQYEGDTLTLKELRESLEASPFGDGNHLSLIGFDACLMSSIELMCVTADYADYLVASQELEPTIGWKYDFLASAAEDTPPELAAGIVKTYMTGCESFFSEHPLFRSDITLAVIDLSKADELEAAVNDLFTAAIEDVSGDFNKLAVARVRSHGFARAGTGSDYDLVDIESLMKEMEEQYPAETVKVREILQNTVVYKDSNIADSCGISLFYPYYNKNYYRNFWKEAYASLECLNQYYTYLERYEQIWLGTDLKELFDGELRPQRGSASTSYTMQLTESQQANYAKSGYYILKRTGEGIYQVVFVSNDVKEENGLLKANYDGNVIYLVDNYGRKHIPPIRAWDTIGGITDYTCLNAALIRESEDGEEVQPCDIQLALDQMERVLSVKGIYPRDPDEEIVAGKREPLFPEDWKTLRIYNLNGHYLTRDEAGRILPYWDWPEGDWVTGFDMPVVNGLNFSYEPLYDDGHEYYIMFELMDVQGNAYSSELLPITQEKAPESSGIDDETEIIWENGYQAEILSEEGVSIGMMADKDRRTGMPAFGFYADNMNDYPITVSLGEFLLDERISPRSGRYLLDLSPGERKVFEAVDFRRALNLENIIRPQKIAFALSVTGSDTDGFLVYDRKFTVQVPDQVGTVDHPLPVLGVSAFNQTIELQDGLSVTVALGREDAFADEGRGALAMDLYFKKEGTSSETIAVGGLKINGIDFPAERQRFLDAGDSWYTTVVIGESEIMASEQGMADIRSVELSAGPKDQMAWYPIDLNLSTGENTQSESVSETSVESAASGEAILFDRNGVKVELLTVRAFDSGDPVYLLRMVNQTDKEISAAISDVRLNTTVCIDADGWITCEADSEITTAYDSLSLALGAAALEKPQSFSGNIEIIYWDEDKNWEEISLADTQFRTELPSAPADILYEPAYAMRAGKQQLVKNDAVRVDLLGCGCIPDGLDIKDLQGTLRIENLSDRAMPFRVNGAKINGFYLSLNDIGSGDIPAGGLRFDNFVCSEERLKQLGIEEISSFELLLLTTPKENTGTVIEAGGSWYAVHLAEHSDKATAFAEGRVLYEDDWARIELISAFANRNESEWSDTKGVCTWNISIAGKSDENIEIKLVEPVVEEIAETEYKPFLVNNQVGANALCTTSIVLYTIDEMPLPEISFGVQVRTAGGGKLLNTGSDRVVISPFQ